MPGAEDIVGLLAQVRVETRSSLKHQEQLQKSVQCVFAWTINSMILTFCLFFAPADRILMWNQTFELALSPTIKCFISIM